MCDWLQPALDHSGTHDMADIEKGVASYRFQLWVGDEGAAVTEVVEFPKKRTLHVFLAGGKLKQIQDFQESAWTWGQSIGCTEMTLAGRLGWARTLKDWEQTGVMMRYTAREETT